MLHFERIDGLLHIGVKLQRAKTGSVMQTRWPVISRWVNAWGHLNSLGIECVAKNVRTVLPGWTLVCQLRDDAMKSILHGSLTSQTPQNP